MIEFGDSPVQQLTLMREMKTWGGKELNRWRSNATWVENIELKRLSGLTYLGLKI